MQLVAQSHTRTYNLDEKQLKEFLKEKIAEELKVEKYKISITWDVRSSSNDDHYNYTPASLDGAIVTINELAIPPGQLKR